MLSVTPTGREYYSAYPTLSNLRQPGLSDATSQKCALFLRQIAARYGLALPARPAGLPDGAQMVWDVLEAIDVASVQLSAISRQLFRLAASGGAMCEDVLFYNQLAVAVYDLQREMLAELEKDGVEGLPELPPWPPLFVGFGNTAAQGGDAFWQLDCESPIVTLATSSNPNGIKLAMSKPCDIGLGGAAVTVIGILAVAGLIYAAVSKLSSASVDKARMREESVRVVENLEMLRIIEDLISKRTKECVDKGGSYQECLQTAKASTANITDIAKANEAAKIEKPAAVRSWLWWAGLVGVIVTGTAVWLWIRRGSSRKDLDGVELIGD